MVYQTSTRRTWRTLNYALSTLKMFTPTVSQVERFKFLLQSVTVTVTVTYRAMQNYISRKENGAFERRQIIISNKHSHTFQNVLSPDESCSGGLAGRGAGSAQAPSGKVYFISINLAGRLDDYYPHVVCYRRLCSAPSLSSTGSLPWRGARSRGPSCSWWAWPPCSWPPRWKKSLRQHALTSSTSPITLTPRMPSSRWRSRSCRR